MTTEAVSTGYRPRMLQQQLHKRLRRFNVLVAHRRFGKTVFCINETIDQALRCEKPQPRYAYIAPLYKQAKSVAWDYLKQYTRPIPGTKFNEAELRADLPNGARIQLFGADNPDALRGIYLDGVVLDEYAQMNARLWPQVVRPALSDRLGWAVFIGTPMGHNAFYELYRDANADNWFKAMHKASETGIVHREELEAARRDMSPEEYDQEFECSWQAAIRGAYYGKLIAEIEDKGQIGNVAYDSTLKVETWWDLGVGDSTVIWFVQRAGSEIHVIDYYEMTGEGLPHYAKVLQDRGYIYGRHIAPHDIKVRELGSGKSRLEIGQSLGIKFDIAPKQSVDDGISAVRSMIPKCWFDRDKCKQGLEALRQYRADYDDRLRTFRTKPLHDWTSHAADAFRYGAVAIPETDYSTDEADDYYPSASGWMM
jgi:hypothetical protein